MVNWQIQTWTAELCNVQHCSDSLGCLTNIVFLFVCFVFSKSLKSKLPLVNISEGGEKKKKKKRKDSNELIL